MEDHHTDLRRTTVEIEADIFEAANNAINSTKTWPAIPFADYIRNMKKVCVWGTNLKIITAASLFQIEIYLAAETYNIGDPQWLLYPPKPVSVLSNRKLLADKPFTTHTLIYHVNMKLLSTMLSPPTHTLIYHVIIETLFGIITLTSKFCYCISL